MIKDFYSLRPLSKANNITDAKITGRLLQHEPQDFRGELKLPKKNVQRWNINKAVWDTMQILFCGVEWVSCFNFPELRARHGQRGNFKLVGKVLIPYLLTSPGFSGRLQVFMKSPDIPVKTPNLPGNTDRSLFPNCFITFFLLEIRKRKIKQGLDYRIPIH